jgi:AraC-like DNA-binding protein
MKAELLKLPNETAHSFCVRHDYLPNINNRWHYHPEMELIYFYKGQGTQFVGDDITRFCPGNLILIGKNLPHFFKYDSDEILQRVDNSPYCTVIHFNEDFWGERFLNLPENIFIKSFFEKAKRGIELNLSVIDPIIGLMNQLVHSEGTKRIVLLLDILILMSKASEFKYLSSVGFKTDFEDLDSDRLNLIYDYSFKSFKKKITLDEIADVSNMTPNSFCRYFKRKTKKTFSNFINDIRVGHACKLLIENKLNIKQICFESGFQNFSSFHSSFKLVTGKSPLNYQHEYLGVAN